MTDASPSNDENGIYFLGKLILLDHLLTQGFICYMERQGRWYPCLSNPEGVGAVTRLSQGG